MSDRGRLIVFAAPAGGGKTTVIKAVRALHPEWSFSCSATTREPRPGEVDGLDYYFLSREEFLRRVAAGEFIEHEVVHGNLYGTLRSYIERALVHKQTMVLDLDVKGAANIKRYYPEALTIFIEPPSLSVLHERLTRRGTESTEVIARRLARAEMEMAQADSFDCVVINQEIEQAVADTLRCIEHGRPLTA